MPGVRSPGIFIFGACTERGEADAARIEVDNLQVAELLETIGNILDILGENAFKVRAYQTAARTVEGLEVTVTSLVRQGKLKDLPGIGEGLAQKIQEYVTSGSLHYLEDLKQKVPLGLLELLKVPGCGPKKIRAVWQELGVTDLESLKQACQQGRVAKLKGFGERTQAKVLEGIEFVASHAGRFRLDQVMPVARSLLAHMGECPQVIRCSLAGSMRRWRETIRDVDILTSSGAPEQVMEHFLQAPGVAKVLGHGPTKSSIQMGSGLQVDLRVVKDDEFAPALAYFTGSKEHNVLIRARAQRMGLTVNEYGIFRGEQRLKVASEEEFYESLGLKCVPPELREARGEVEAAETGVLPALIERSHVVGVFHVHSTWSDGTVEIVEMAEKARKMGLKYMGLSDHSKAAAYAGGLDEARLESQMREVERLNERWSDFRILKGLECDILPDGTLDLNAGILAQLDFVIGSIHSRFDMSEEEMTGRVCKALDNNNLDILGHPTGRLLLSRAGYKIDLERVLQEAKRLRKVVELNANPNRLDLDWIHLKRARDLGVMVSINPDAHSPQGLEDVEYGVATARRGWLSAKEVLNTRSADEALSHFHRG